MSEINTISDNISCPVSNILINENRVRLTAALVFLTSLAYLFFPHWAFPAFLGIDFLLRASGNGRYSPLNSISGALVKRFAIKNRPIDQAPKLFAAKLGFAFAVLLLIANLFALTEAASSITAILLLFSFLESALGVCAGCYVYTLLKKLFPRIAL